MITSLSVVSSLLFLIYHNFLSLYYLKGQIWQAVVAAMVSPDFFRAAERSQEPQETVRIEERQEKASRTLFSYSIRIDFHRFGAEKRTEVERDI